MKKCCLMNPHTKKLQEEDRTPRKHILEGNGTVSRKQAQKVPTTRIQAAKHTNMEISTYAKLATYTE